MTPDFGVLILGGGCAGLSLGVRLAERPAAHGRTLILEARDRYDNDRTWCFWRHGPHRFEPLVSRSWRTLSLGTPDREIRVDCGATPYQLIAAEAFYSGAQAAIAGSDAVRLQLGRAAQDAPRRVAEGWRVETADGPVTAACVVDTRPPGCVRADDALLWQSFFGQDVTCEAPVFDPGVAGLMHFDPLRTQDVAFRYVLPSSRHSALVETTVFGPHRLAEADLAGAQAAAVSELCRGAPVHIRRSERGVLPMGLASRVPPPAAGLCHAGLTSGAARASTGYAFQRIQRWADAAAAALAGGAMPPGHVLDPALQRGMDRLFLRVLRRYPARAPDLFLGMFGKDPASVIRFLSDRGTPADCVRIGLALPVPLFLGEMARALAGRPAAPRASL